MAFKIFMGKNERFLPILRNWLWEHCLLKVCLWAKFAAKQLNAVKTLLILESFGSKFLTKCIIQSSNTLQYHQMSPIKETNIVELWEQVD